MRTRCGPLSASVCSSTLSSCVQLVVLAEPETECVLLADLPGVGHAAARPSRSRCRETYCESGAARLAHGQTRRPAGRARTQQLSRQRATARCSPVKKDGQRADGDGLRRRALFAAGRQCRASSPHRVTCRTSSPRYSVSLTGDSFQTTSIACAVAFEQIVVTATGQLHAPQIRGAAHHVGRDAPRQKQLAGCAVLIQQPLRVIERVPHEDRRSCRAPWRPAFAAPDRARALRDR